MRRLLFALLLMAGSLGGARGALAGPYSDDLAKCLVEHTTPDDRAALIRWLFASASRHPAVKSLANVSDAQLDESNKAIGILTTDLIAVRCKDQSQKASRFEGKESFRLAFEVLGKVAGQELFSSPEVAANMAGLVKYLDKDKLRAAQEPASP